MIRKEYKVEIVQEGTVGTLLFGASKVPVAKMEKILNHYGKEGWDVSFMILERRRTLLFWVKEVVVITFTRQNF